MRLPEFRGLRGRLSYANVMATLAFFFALTGGAMAGVKYLSASDTIPPTSDLADSTFGNPVIAAGKVTSGKIADGAITSSKFDASATAPNASLLAGHTASGFLNIVGSGSLTYTGSIPPGECRTLVGSPPAGADRTTDFVIVQPNRNLSLQIDGGFLSVNEPPAFDVAINLCNNRLFDDVATDTYRYVIVR